jgi:hypothetical protein
MKNVVVIGAGQLGSRHTQALKAVTVPLQIWVVDPSAEALALTRQRYADMPGDGSNHRIEFGTELPASITAVDVAIIATNADVRLNVLRNLLAGRRVSAAILEKILFRFPGEYDEALRLISAAGTKAWVNCCMRQSRIYDHIWKTLRGTGRISYRVSGSVFGLMTNAIHYVDHACHLLGSTEFSVDPEGLDRGFIASKRRGFSECTGELQVAFADGSAVSLVCFAEGNTPIVVEISSGAGRFIVREVDGVTYYSGAKNGWGWEQFDGTASYQSKLTTPLVEGILAAGTSMLTPLAESIEIHRNLFEPIRHFFGTDGYPFT